MSQAGAIIATSDFGGGHTTGDLVTSQDAGEPVAGQVIVAEEE